MSAFLRFGKLNLCWICGMSFALVLRDDEYLPEVWLQRNPHCSIIHQSSPPSLLKKNQRQPALQISHNLVTIWLKVFAQFIPNRLFMPCYDYGTYQSSIVDRRMNRAVAWIKNIMRTAVLSAFSACLTSVAFIFLSNLCFWFLCEGIFTVYD